MGGAPDRPEWLGLPDRAVADAPSTWCHGGRTDPGAGGAAVVVTFGPDGIFGHPDHIAIGAATDQAFASLRSKDSSVSGWCTAPSRSPCSNDRTLACAARALHLRPDDDVPPARRSGRASPDHRRLPTRHQPHRGGLREHKSQLHACPTTPPTPGSGSNVCVESGTHRMARDRPRRSHAHRPLRGPLRLNCTRPAFHLSGRAAPRMQDARAAGRAGSTPTPPDLDVGPLPP